MLPLVVVTQIAKKMPLKDVYFNIRWSHDDTSLLAKTSYEV